MRSSGKCAFNLELLKSCKDAWFDMPTAENLLPEGHQLGDAVPPVSHELYGQPSPLLNPVDFSCAQLTSRRTHESNAWISSQNCPRAVNQQNCLYSSFAVVEPEASGQPPLSQEASMGEEKIIDLSKCMSFRTFLAVEGATRTLSPRVVGDASF